MISDILLDAICDIEETLAEEPEMYEEQEAEIRELVEAMKDLVHDLYEPAPWGARRDRQQEPAQS